MVLTKTWTVSRTMVRGVGFEPTEAFARGSLMIDLLSPPPFPRVQAAI